MSNKLSTIIGLFNIFIAFLFGVDLVLMQYIYTDLDSLSLQTNYEISKKGYLTEELKVDFQEKYSVKLYPIEENNLAQSYKEGYIYGYILERDYSPIALSKSTINIKVKRFTVINIYN
jgi:hypothetical protein